MNRRDFFKRFGASAAAIAACTAAGELDVDKLLWTPGEKTIFIPKAPQLAIPPSAIDWSRVTGVYTERLVPHGWLKAMLGEGDPVARRIYREALNTHLPRYTLVVAGEGVFHLDDRKDGGMVLRGGRQIDHETGEAVPVTPADQAVIFGDGLEPRYNRRRHPMEPYLTIEWVRSDAGRPTREIAPAEAYASMRESIEVKKKEQL